MGNHRTRVWIWAFLMVACGPCLCAARPYPDTLVSIARPAFQPVVPSLRLIDLVESRSTLASRTEHILNRPIPTPAKLCGAGLGTVAFLKPISLPMAAAPNSAGPASTPIAESSGTQDTAGDSDGDGLSDFDEIHKYLTDPAKKDSDGDGLPDSDWRERRECTYSVRTVLRHLPPCDEKALHDDFQDARVLKRTNEYIEVEVIHYPFATAQESIPENRTWRQDYAHMSKFLAPGVTTNWDEQMRHDLLAALKADGVAVDTLTDKQVVTQVSRWLLNRSRDLGGVFTTFHVHYPQGKPEVYPGLESSFRGEFERNSGNYDWTIEQHFDHELLGKGMFYNKTHGTCTSTAVYLTTVLRALGIPTRMILATPAVDASDHGQILMIRDAITHHRVRMTMLAGLRYSTTSFVSHTFNEVYVGNRWCRLDYTQLGCSNFGLHRLGLQTHLYTFNDLSDANLAPTWGRRCAKGEHSEAFRHVNPYTAVAMSEFFGPHGKIPNPPCTAQEIDPHPQPEIFLFHPLQVDVTKESAEAIGSAGPTTWRPHQKEFYQNLFEGIWLARPQDILVLLFSLDTPERIPEGYEDLLPKRWDEIEAQLRRGRTVELSGQTRGINVIVMAAPKVDGLKSLVQNSKRLAAIGGPHPAPGVRPTQTQSASDSAGYVVKLAGGVTVELLGVCEHPSEGKQWWRPDGSPLEKAPYKTTGEVAPARTGFRLYEFALRLAAPDDAHIRWVVPGSSYGSNTGPPIGHDGKRLRDLRAYKASEPEDRNAVEVRVGVAADEWQIHAMHGTLDKAGVYTLDDHRAVAFGAAYSKDGGTFLPVTMNFLPDQADYRVVALDDESKSHTARGSPEAGNVLLSVTCRFDLPLDRVKEFRFQTRPYVWVIFRNVSLRPRWRAHVVLSLLCGVTATDPLTFASVALL